MSDKPCIRCSDCALVCPVNLQPQFLHASIHAKAWDKAEFLHIEACLLCNACTAACPSEINLREQFEAAQLLINDQRLQREKSQQAKMRFEAKQLRLEKNKILQEKLRAEKLKSIGALTHG